MTRQASPTLSARPIEGVNMAALEVWMNGQGLGSGKMEDAELLTGGTQNVLLKFRRDDATYVLRRPPVALRANSNDTMRREVRVLSALGGSVVPHPRLIAACLDETVLGAVFYLMDSVEGFTATNGLPALHATDPAIRRRMGLAMVEGIAALGAIDFEAVGLKDFGRPENYLERQVSRWKSQLASYECTPGWGGPSDLPGVEKIGQWLETHRPSLFVPGIMHGDYHLANVMFRHDNGELAAIVDWELSSIGEPLLDLGWLLATWREGDLPDAAAVAVEPWDSFVSSSELTNHYAVVSGRDVSEIDWYVVLACYKLGIILEGTHARACAGQAPLETGNRLHNQAVALFERALRRVG